MLYVISFIFGAVVGSFLNVCIYRLPREESIVFPPSHCTDCGTGIKAYHNIPILSYLFLGGKCASCGSRISFMYPFVEALSGLLLLFIFWKYGLSWPTLFYTIFAFSLVVITFIDLEHFIIPNVITFPGVAVGLIFNAIITDWAKFPEVWGAVEHDVIGLFQLAAHVPVVDGVLGAILGGGVLYLIAFLYELIRKREGMGMGDVKLLAMIGAFLGWKGVIFVAFVSSLLGTIVGISIILYQRGDLKYAIPFGPFLSIAAIIYIFTGGFSFSFN